MTRIGALTFSRLCAALLVVFVSGCVYEAPLTSKPTGKIDDRLLGDWGEQESGAPGGASLKIRKLDDSNYIISYNGFFRAFHSDLGENHFVSIQNIEPASDKERKYTVATYELKDGGNTLVVRTVNNAVIPESLKTAAEMEKAIRANLKNPELFNKEPGIFTRAKATTQPYDPGAPAVSPSASP